LPATERSRPRRAPPSKCGDAGNRSMSWRSGQGG
jgi:hypothetical protein